MTSSSPVGSPVGSINEPIIRLIVVDQHGVTEELHGVRANQPLLEVALRLDTYHAQQQSLIHGVQQGLPSPPVQLPEVDLLTMEGDTLSPVNTPASASLTDGGQICCYRYGQVCREYKERHIDSAILSAASCAAQTESSTTLPGKAAQSSSSPQYVGIYLSDWVCGYQRRILLHHDLTLPFEVLLRPYCSLRGIRVEDTSFVWLQFYRKVNFNDTGKGMDIEDGDCIFAYSNKQLQGKLWDAVFSGDVGQVEDALAAGATVTSGPLSMEYLMGGRYPLHVAAAENHSDIIRLLVSRGASVNQLDAASEPALWHAIENDHEAAIRALIDLGATSADLFPLAEPTKISDDLCTAVVTEAAEARETNRVRGQDAQHYAALAHCASRGHLAGMQMLLERPCNQYAQDQDGYTTYDYVMDQGGPTDLLRLILEHDKRFAKVQEQYQEQYSRLCQAVKKSQRYPLALGCPCRSCNSLVEVRATESDLSRAIKSEIGCVAMVRVVQAGKGNSVEMLGLLHRHGALLNGQDGEGRTALHQAARFNRVAEARWLLEAGARTDIPDFEGLLPLHQAACSGCADVARLLVEHSAPINHHTTKYITQEVLEAQAKRLEAATSSNTKKAGSGSSKKRAPPPDISGLVTIGGNSALALAVRHGSTKVVEYLLQQGAVFDLKNTADSSAFHAALDRGAATIANLLLMRRAPVGKGISSTLSASSSAVAALMGLPTTKSSSTSKSKMKQATSSASKESAVIKVTQAEKKNGKGKASSSLPLSATEGVVQSAKSGLGSPSVTAPLASEHEPAMATEAGSVFLKQIAEEREQLRQKLGLSRPESSSLTMSAAVSSLPSISEQLLRPQKPPVVSPPVTAVRPPPLPSAALLTEVPETRQSDTMVTVADTPSADHCLESESQIGRPGASSSQTCQIIPLSQSTECRPPALPVVHASACSTAAEFPKESKPKLPSNVASREVRSTAIMASIPKEPQNIVLHSSPLSTKGAPKSSTIASLKSELCAPSTPPLAKEVGAPMGTRGVQILFRRTPPSGGTHPEDSTIETAFSSSENPTPPSAALPHVINPSCVPLSTADGPERSLDKPTGQQHQHPKLQQQPIRTLMSSAAVARASSAAAAAIQGGSGSGGSSPSHGASPIPEASKTASVPSTSPSSAEAAVAERAAASSKSHVTAPLNLSDSTVSSKKKKTKKEKLSASVVSLDNPQALEISDVEGVGKLESDTAASLLSREASDAVTYLLSTSIPARQEMRGAGRLRDKEDKSTKKECLSQQIHEPHHHPSFKQNDLLGLSEPTAFPSSMYHDLEDMVASVMGDEDSGRGKAERSSEASAITGSLFRQAHIEGVGRQTSFYSNKEWNLQCHGSPRDNKSALEFNRPEAGMSSMLPLTSSWGVQKSFTGAHHEPYGGPANESRSGLTLPCSSDVWSSEGKADSREKSISMEALISAGRHHLPVSNWNSKNNFPQDSHNLSSEIGSSWSSSALQGHTSSGKSSSQLQDREHVDPAGPGLAMTHQESPATGLWLRTPSPSPVHQSSIPRAIEKLQQFALPDLPASLFDDLPDPLFEESQLIDLPGQNHSKAPLEYQQQEPHFHGMHHMQHLTYPNTPYHHLQQQQQQQQHILHSSALPPHPSQQHASDKEGFTALNRHMQRQQQALFEQMQQHQHVASVEWQNMGMHYGHPPPAGWGCAMPPMPPPGYPPFLPPHFGPSLGMAPSMSMPSGGQLPSNNVTATLDHPSSLSAFHQQIQQQYDYHHQYIQMQQQLGGCFMASGSGMDGGPSTISKALEVKTPPDIIARQQGSQ